MPYYKTCRLCGATLDPGERCDCQDKEEAPSATNTEDGKVDQKLTDHRPTSILPKTNQ